MDTLQLQNVQILPAHYSRLHVSKQQRSLSFVSISKQGSGCNSFLSNHTNNILFSKDVSANRIRCCAPAHPPLNGSLPATNLKKGSFKSHDETTLLLKKKAGGMVSDLRGTCIYLVGMMGSGKSTVGRVLAEALGYHFVDSDKVIEEAAGGVSVAELFKQLDETRFRDAETQVLKQLSCNLRFVVATGGGIVIRPENWGYLRYGVTVWLDVPLESLAERVVAAGTHSRPLLGGDHKGDSAHTRALAKLTSIYESRASCYANADAIVSLQSLASSLGYHVHDLTPTLIAIQALEEISKLLSHKNQKESDLGAPPKVVT